MNLLRRQCLIREGSLQGVQIMCPNCYQCPLAREVLVELVLKSDEGLVSCLGEFDVPQYRT